MVYLLERRKNDNEWSEYDILLDRRTNNSYKQLKELLYNDNSTKVLLYIIDRGNEKQMNFFNPFPAYSIAKRIIENGWFPSKKQQESIVNVFIQSELRLDKIR